MKILHITNNYPTENYPIFGIFVKEQIDSLNKIGVESDVFFINGRKKGKLEYISCVWKLKQRIKNGDYDIIHCHHSFSAVSALLLAHLHKKLPVVISFQSDPLNEAKFNLFPLLSKRSSAWIFKNNSVYAVRPKGFYLPNGVNTDFFKPIPRVEACEKLKLDPLKKYVLFVSSNFIRKEKRYDKFLGVIKILKENYGLTNLEELRLINVERELVPYYFNAASVHLLTSDFEGSPNSVKEAMACNIPVVSTNVGNVADLLAAVHGSYIVNSGNVDDLAVHVMKSLNSNVLNSRKVLIKKRLDIDSVANNLKAIYLKLL